MSTRVVVIGGGSAGVGAAYRAAMNGAEVCLVESGACLGGTSTLGGVHCWEPGIASFGLNRLLYQKMRRTPLGVSVGRTIHAYDPESHIGLNGIDLNLKYEESLRRGNLGVNAMARVHFEPYVLANAMTEALQETGVRLIMNTAFIESCVHNDRIESVVVKDMITGEEYRIFGDVFIDCTADAVVCRKAGLKTRFGEDDYDSFHEPSAPDKATGIVNGVSLCFRTASGDDKDEIPAWARNTEAADWIKKGNLPCSNVDMYPNGDRNYNPLPLMDGADYFSLSPMNRLHVLTARVWLYWEWMKKEHGHAGHHIIQIMPRVGVRESWRVCTMEMTTEHDLRKGCFSQNNEIVALADHTLDTHGQRSTELRLPNTVEIPYGIRAKSLIVSEYSNLLVSGRCAGFSHLAASSCRLSRTMLDLGEAAGAMAAQGGDMRESNIAAVREALNFDKYLDWVDKCYRSIGEEQTS